MTREEVDRLLAQTRRDCNRDQDSDHVTTTVYVTLPEKFTGDGKTSWTEWFGKWSQEVPNFFGKTGHRKIYLLRKATTGTAQRVLRRILDKDESLEQGGKFAEVQELMRQQFMGPNEGYGSLLRDPKYLQKPGERVIDYEHRVRQLLNGVAKDNAFMTQNNIEPSLCHLLIYNLRPELAADMKRFKKGYTFPQLLEEAEAIEKDLLRFNGGSMKETGSFGRNNRNDHQIEQKLDEVQRSIRQLKNQQGGQYRPSNSNYNRDNRRSNYGGNFQNVPNPTAPQQNNPASNPEQIDYATQGAGVSAVYCDAALFPPQSHSSPARDSSYASKTANLNGKLPQGRNVPRPHRDTVSNERIPSGELIVRKDIIGDGIRNAEGRKICQVCGVPGHFWTHCYHNAEYKEKRGWRFVYGVDRPWNPDLPLPRDDNGQPIFNEEKWEKEGKLVQIRPWPQGKDPRENRSSRSGNSRTGSGNAVRPGSRL